MLDSEEYFHLAINATQNNQHHAALEYLHKCLELSPTNAGATFLLAAEHAELGLFTRAIEGLKKCLELDPGIEMAYFQLGLLQLQQGDEPGSQQQWRHLSENSNDPALSFFAQGMLLLDSDKAEAIELIGKAIAQDSPNKAFQSSMENILARISSPAQGGQAAAESTDPEPMHPMFLNAYKHSSFEPDEN